MKKPLTFEIHTELPGTLGRAGTIHTPHGDILTPAFVTVGTKGTVKALTPEQVQATGAQVVLANTYHLYLEPSDEQVAKLGGLQKMMNWHGPTMTDSGGFQVFSLGVAYGTGLSKILKHNDEKVLPARAVRIKMGRGDDETESQMDALNASAISAAGRPARIDPNGVTFRSHIDGSAHYFTPQKSIAIQHNLGADIIFAFDECTSPHESLHYQKEALERTHRWAKQSLAYHHSTEHAGAQALFGIVQGGRDETLRRESATAIANMSVSTEHGEATFDGFGIGGSFEKEDMMNAVRWCNEILPRDKPRHLLGVGEPADLFGAVENGCDLFDCVAPTRIARTGQVYTREGKVNLENATYRDDPRPIDPAVKYVPGTYFSNADCTCYTCQNFSRAYIAHLFRSKEMLAATLASIHNLHFIIHLVDTMRATLLDSTFPAFKQDFLERYEKSIK